MKHIIIALQCEAKPLISHYKLKGRPHSQAFRIYEKDDMVLTVSGIGKVASAAATAYTQVLFGNRDNNAWLNLGIAGHGHRAIGEAVLARKITDDETQRQWYPPLIFSCSCDTENVITLGKPAGYYVDNAVYEMEASGFYATATRFSTSELVHCFKVISDNKDQPASRVSEPLTQRLIEQNIDTIDQVLNELDQMAGQLETIEAIPKDFQFCCERWHFTSYQQSVLQRSLKRLEALSYNNDFFYDEVCRLKNGKDVLRYLQQKIDELATNTYVTNHSKIIS